MNGLLDFFFHAAVVFGAAALVFNVHKYGIDPTLAAIAKWVKGAEAVVATDAEIVYHKAAAELTAASSSVKNFVQRMEVAVAAATAAAKLTAATQAAQAAVAAPAPQAEKVAEPDTPIPVAPIKPEPVTPAVAFIRYLNSMGLTAGQIAYLKSVGPAVFGEWCAHALELPGVGVVASEQAGTSESVGWLTGLTVEGHRFLGAIALAIDVPIPDKDPR